ncbi:ABC transporter ATP-binding protein/permease [Agromyces sp. SYSU K20354]|uniref:ABC transporter ATP-binding protein n=1 Tax=Agromyces cavernae TaxID=2898659 RepID=UPI001E5E6562|nr:ABC transporter ATP-binding protein [Agromyces cavernae]MCD2441011.1 ABC transporter ATP-binding protein/permease [Agromyces cavernae]
MAREADKVNLRQQLGQLLGLAGANPRSWILGVVIGSIALALLDTLGVAAMAPLMQLITTGSADSGILADVSAFLGTSSPQTLIPIVAGIVAALFILKSVLALLFRWWILGRTTRISALASSQLMRMYILAPYADHRSRRTSEIYRSVSDSTAQSTSVLLAVTALFTDGLVLVALAVVIAVVSPTVMLVTAVIFGVLVFGVQRMLRNRQSRIGEEVSASALQSWQYLLPALDGFREARLTSSANAFADGYRQAKLRTAHAGRQLAIISDAPRYLLEIGFVLAIIGISAVLTATTSPAETLTILAVFGAASVRALPTMNRVASSLATIRTGRVGLDIVTRIADELRDGGMHDETPRAAVRFGGDIALQDIEFRYPDAERPVLDEISLDIAENRTTAFVGSSGAGKSTLLDLVLGLLEPTSGTIECGGRSIHDDLPSWFAELGVVPQDVFLLNDTLAANIAFGVPASDIDLARVTEVITTAQLDAVVADLPHGLQTEVGERGVRLSGGQRQRIGLARALYRQPRILVLDEATSALDNATEHEIATTLRSLQGSITILIVAHRLSTVRNADTLVFLKNGRIEEVGTFEHVRATNPDFARLVQLGELN